MTRRNSTRSAGLVTTTKRPFSLSKDRESDPEHQSDVEKLPSDLEEEVILEEESAAREDISSLLEKESLGVEAKEKTAGK